MIRASFTMAPDTGDPFIQRAYLAGKTVIDGKISGRVVMFTDGYTADDVLAEWTKTCKLLQPEEISHAA